MHRIIPTALLGLILVVGLPGLPLPGGAHARAWAGDDGIEDAIDAQTEDEISEQVEDAVEEDIEDQVSDRVEEEIDAEVEDRVEESIQSDVEDSVENDVEDSIEAEVEDRVEADVEDSVEADVEDRVEDAVEDSVEADVEDAVESDVEADVEEDVEQDVEEDVEDEIESDVEDDLEAEVEQDVEDDMEDDLESDIEENVEDDLEGDVEDAMENELESEIEDDMELEFDDEPELEPGDDLESDVDDAMEDAAPEDAGRDAVVDSRQPALDERGGKRSPALGAVATESAPRSAAATGTGNGVRPGQAPQATGAAAEHFAGLDADDEGNEISLGEWLVIASRDDIAALEALGYVTRNVEPLEGLDRVLATMEAPESFDIAAAQAAIGRAAPQAEVDYNHIYRPEARQQPHASGGGSPGELFPAAASVRTPSAPIGLIDTAIDAGHPALRAANVQYRDFTPPGQPRPSAHGTSVLSILVGEAPGYRGLVPGASALAGAVFFNGPDGREIATTSSLVRALDWMTVNRVPVVNMSLAGPRNAILATAIDRAFDTGTVVVAAVGNRGPAARPLYPAAYERVIAVTAVNGSRVYRLANRGAHVDFAAPGVDVLHADREAGYRSSSGTSLAAPFVTAVIATSCADVRPIDACLQALQRSAEDIGEAGFDPVFGHGLIVPLRSSAPP